MMRAALRFISTEVRGLQKAVYVLAVCALLSSLLALVRDRLLASAFGAATTLDIYYAAFRIPDFIFIGTGALVSVYMLIPELVRRSSDDQKKYFDTIILGFFVLAVFVSGLAYVCAPFILSILFPQFVTLGHLDELVGLSRIMLLQPILLGFSNIFAAITQSRHRYALYAISPLLYNTGIIVGVLIFYPLWGITGLAWGVVLGALLHVTIQIPAVLADGFLQHVPRIWNTRFLWETAFVSVPRALALSMNQVTFIGLTAFAGALTPGSIAVFMFAYNLQAVPLSIIGASYSVAAFPTLSAALSSGRREEFITHVAHAARYVFFWSLPFTALAIVLRAHIVRVVLGAGRFDWTDTRLTAASFALFSIALAAQSLQLLLVRGYYAAGRTFVPFLVSAGMTVGTIGLAAIFIGVLKDHTLLRALEILMRVEDISGTHVLALALSFSLVSIIGSVILMFHFEYRFRGFLSSIVKSMGESVIAAFAAGMSAYATLTIAGPLTFNSTVLSVLSRGFLAGSLGILSAAVVYYLVGNSEQTEIIASIRGKIPWIRTLIGEVSIASSAEDGGPTMPQ